MKNATNQTTKEQGIRLLMAGCPYVKLHLTPGSHQIVPDPIELGRLWDIAGIIGVKAQYETGLTSKELTEAIVKDIVDHYARQKDDQGEQ